MQEKHHPIDLGDRERLPEKLARAEIPYTVFSSALDSSGFGLTQADPEARRYTYANAAFCNMFGYSIDELIGGDLTFADLVEPDDDAGRLGEFVRLVCGEIDICTIENRYIHKDGSMIPARAVISVLERDGANRAVLTTGSSFPCGPDPTNCPARFPGFRSGPAICERRPGPVRQASGRCSICRRTRPAPRSKTFSPASTPMIAAVLSNRWRGRPTARSKPANIGSCGRRASCAGSANR
jgi:PAS domain S-box-containing protein